MNDDSFIYAACKCLVLWIGAGNPMQSCKQRAGRNISIEISSALAEV